VVGSKKKKREYKKRRGGVSWSALEEGGRKFKKSEGDYIHDIKHWGVNSKPSDRQNRKVKLKRGKVTEAGSSKITIPVSLGWEVFGCKRSK